MALQFQTSVLAPPGLGRMLGEIRIIPSGVAEFFPSGQM
ncbi:hypothetical protein thalar_03472 [Litoreibacter arenae DSM 19593]|uniref:Uncharacterized protein n=1 Tax=Litoreibacter arenae DSM 19593 TaxID=1123360 RepID=S9QCS8_9RHOB|nr:hypothetical protein thalar_03472 [Litoreibacter arenae DSM 19593]